MQTVAVPSKPEYVVLGLLKEPEATVEEAVALAVPLVAFVPARAFVEQFAQSVVSITV